MYRVSHAKFPFRKISSKQKPWFFVFAGKKTGRRQLDFGSNLPFGPPAASFKEYGGNVTGMLPGLSGGRI